MNKIKIVGIAGGSGSGKSTIAIALHKKYLQSSVILHLDDYFKKPDEAPRLGKFINWEHPDGLMFDKLLTDLLSLKAGLPINVKTKSELYNPEYDISKKNYKNIIIEPKPVIFVEGYLLFHDERIREIIDYKIFLDISIDESLKRRGSNKFSPDAEYINSVLIPMHNQFVSPTKKYADIVIDALNNDKSQVLKLAEDGLSAFLISC